MAGVPPGDLSGSGPCIWWRHWGLADWGAVRDAKLGARWECSDAPRHSQPSQRPDSPQMRRACFAATILSSPRATMPTDVGSSLLRLIVDVDSARTTPRN
ncbi:hypothetical protein PMIN04_006278 [Paraphaeosphaeria minitans]